MTEKQSVVIFGFESYGEELGKHLRLTYNEIIIVERKKSLVEKAKEHGYLNIVEIDFSDDEQIVKKLPQLKGNAMAFCALNDDANNMFLAISLRSLFEKLHIVAISETRESANKLYIAGANKVIVMEESGAHMLFNLLERESVNEAINEIFFAQNTLRIAEMQIRKESFLDGAYMHDIKLQETYNVIIIGIVDQELSHRFLFSTSGFNHKIDHNDTLVLMGQNYDIDKLKSDMREK